MRKTDMIRRRLPALLAAMGLVLTIAFSSAGRVHAASAPTSAGGNGMRISPVHTDLTINPGQSATVMVNVQNVTGAPENLQALVNDFTADGSEKGQPAIILDPTKYAPSHSLKRYIAPLPNVTLNPNEQKSVKVVINIPKDAAGGGYYGAIRFVPASSGNDSKSISLSASVASLILVKVPGNIKDDLRLASLDVRQKDSPRVFFTNNKNIIAAVRFQNLGNIQEQPFGKLILKHGNTILETTEINDTDPRGNVLPDSIRRFDVSLDKVGSFGKYTVQGNFGFGSSGQLLSGQTTFYIVPLSMIVLGVVLLLVVLFLVFGAPKLVRRYNQGVLRKAGRR